MDLKDAVDLYRDVLRRYSEGFSLDEVLGSIAEAIGGKRAILFVRRDMSSFLEPKLAWNMAEEDKEPIKDSMLPLDWVTRQPARRYVVLDKERLSELGIEQLGEKSSDIIILFPIRSHAHLRAALLIVVGRESQLPDQQGFKVAAIGSILERMVELFSFEERPAQPEGDGEPSRVELGILSNYLLGKTDYARAASLSLDLLIKLLNMDGGTVHRVKGALGQQQATLIASRGWGGMPEIIDHLFENQLIDLLQAMPHSEEKEVSLDAGRIAEYFPGVKPYFHANQVKSFLLTPIFHGNKLVGLLTLFGKAYTAMEPKDMELLVRLADRLGALFAQEEEGYRVMPVAETWDFPVLVENLFQLQESALTLDDFLSSALRLVAIDLSAAMALAYFGDESGPDRKFMWYAADVYGEETVFSETPGLARMAMNLQRIAVVKPENPIMKELPAFEEAKADRLVLLLMPARARGSFLLLGFYLPAEKRLRKAEMSSLNPLAAAFLGLAVGLKEKGQSQGYRRSLEILTEIEGDLTASEDPKQVLRILARGGRELLDCDRAAIIILDEVEGTFEGITEVADRAEAVKLSPFAGHEIAQALESGRALYSPEEEIYGNASGTDEERSLIAVPLMGRTGKLGALVFERIGRKDYFGGFQRSLAHFLAGQAVSVLESYREGRRLEAAADENKQLLRMSRRLSSSLTLKEMCGGLYKEFEQLLGTELLLLSIQGKAGDRRLVLFKGEREKAEAFNELLEPQGALMAALARAGRVMRNNLNTFLRDPGEDELAAKGIRSYMAIALRGEDIKGVFLLGSTRGAVFGEREANLIEKTTALINSFISMPLRNEALQGRIRLLEEMYRSQEEKLQSKTDLINMASHEIRHPLTLIMGFSEVLRDYGDTLDEGESREVADKLHKAADRLRRSVVNMMEISQIESGKLTVQAEEIDLKPLLISLTEELKARSLQHEVEVEVEDEAATIIADRDKLEIILFNLMDNAVKYSPPGSIVNVFARRSDSEILIEVKDQGQGISEEYLNFIFQPFRRGESKEQGPIKGMGLGLYIVNRLVEAHGGRIEVRSEHGRGSTFIARIPQTAPAVQRFSNPGLLRA